jgi:hypothetical protein
VQKNRVLKLASDYKHRGRADQGRPCKNGENNSENSHDLKVCGDYTLIQILSSWLLLIVLNLFKTQRFGYWILSPSSGKTYSVGSNR